jgi:hypothetical protein
MFFLLSHRWCDSNMIALEENIGDEGVDLFCFVGGEFVEDPSHPISFSKFLLDLKLMFMVYSF